MDTLQVTYEKSLYQKPVNDDGSCWAVHMAYNETHGMVNCPGLLDQGSLVPGLQLELSGDWVQSPKYGKQFAIKQSSRARPAGRDGICAFLRIAPGIGTKIAQALYDLYGESAIDALITQPDEASKSISGLTNARAKDASAALAELYEESKLMIPLVSLFAGVKFPRTLPKQVIESKLPDPVASISRNPFILTEFSKVGFRLCDELRKKLKLPHDMPERQRAAAYQAFQDKSDTVWVHFDKIKKEVANFLEVPDAVAVATLRELYTRGMITKEGAFLGLVNHVQDEIYVTKSLIQLTQHKVSWPLLTPYITDGTAPGVTQYQCDEFQKSIQGALSVFTGKPGTGKTHTTLWVVKAALKAGLRVQACAPTGKAAQRMNQKLRSDDETRVIVAQTVHKTLVPRMKGTGFSFELDGTGDDRFIETDLLVLDESSMLDNWLAACVFRALKAGTRVMIVGDQKQLAPVGRGAMLRDYIQYCDDSKGRLKYGQLTEVIRNQGAIMAACREIYDGRAPMIKYVEKPGLTDTPNLQMAIAIKDEDMARQVRLFVQRLKEGQIKVNGKSPHPLRDVQFLVAINKDSPVSREELNKFLQKELNPNAQGDHPVYKLGDKIICLENCKLEEYDSDTERAFPVSEEHPKVVVSNGELGLVVKSHAKRIVVCMASDETKWLIVPTGAGIGGWDLGYAITGHKAQGSEWMLYFAILGRGNRASRVICREWIYTVLSRATALGIVCGTNAMIKDAVKTVRMFERKSFFDKWAKEAENE